MADKGLSLGRRVAGRLIKPANDLGHAVSWVEECRTKHSKRKWGDWMPERAFTPTRLIEVGPSKSACKSTYGRLISGCDAIGEYVTFSHCWGSQPVCQTTKQSISDFGTEIPWDCLSKTFQDAIEITQALGIPYLWIDSLCIVQDDPWYLFTPLA